MQTNLTIITAAPNELAEDDLDMFKALVAGGGEVPGVALSTNVKNAKALAMCRSHGAVVGVAALKRPQANYRKRLGDTAGFALDQSTYSYELGYILLLPEARGRGASHLLVSTTLEHADGAGVFATTRTDNIAMLATLTKAGLERVGDDYSGRGARVLRLLVRQAGQEAPVTDR